MSLTQFHLFPVLPSELRLKIYNHVFSEPRTVCLTSEKRIIRRQEADGERYLQTLILKSSTPPPALLYVSRESRAEALKIYTATRTTNVHSLSLEEFVEQSHVVYVNFEQDTIHIPGYPELKHLAQPTKQSVKSLVIDVSDPSYFGHFAMEDIKALPCLEELRLLCKSTEFNRPMWSRSSIEILRDALFDEIEKDVEFEELLLRYEEILIQEGGRVNEEAASLHQRACAKIWRRPNISLFDVENCKEFAYFDAKKSAIAISATDPRGPNLQGQETEE